MLKTFTQFLLLRDIVDMAVASPRQYNLHPARQETIQLPVQLQLANDNTSLICFKDSKTDKCQILIVKL